MLFYTLNVFSLALFGLASAALKTNIPVITCKRDSIDYTVCLKHAIEEAWPRFVKGLPEFDFSPLDPLFYKYGKAEFNSDILHAEMSMSNVTANGLAEAHFNGVRSYFLDDVFHLEIDTQLPKLLIKGVINLAGSIGVFRTFGKGSFNVIGDDARTTWDLTGHVVNDTWIVERFRVMPSFGKIVIYFDNVLEDKGLNDIVANFINEYWPPIYRVVLPTAADAWEPWLVNFANNFFSKVPFSEIFP
ncbi:PREDICTED: uncharacterized protein LOC105461050 [Wasmannia auropunctata]|uniref:uncharacterized protein LOC105461050 n=1 Tax=Wasmannia auropunctata TaxID=64793 RepID=UPI0005EECDB2|nr:PREDICTED: uncharacterized protein LOC105461050 [Wasmannia auropunctata]